MFCCKYESLSLPTFIVSYVLIVLKIKFENDFSHIKKNALKTRGCWNYIEFKAIPEQWRLEFCKKNIVVKLELELALKTFSDPWGRKKKGDKKATVSLVALRNTTKELNIDASIKFHLNPNLCNKFAYKVGLQNHNSLFI